MKLVIDEKLKHRLIGLAVVFSIAAIFAPAMMKKSNQNMENKYSVRVKLPSKPAAPNVAITDEKEVFKTIKVAKVNIAQVSSEGQLPQIARAKVLHADRDTSHETVALDTSRVEKTLNKTDLALNNSKPKIVKQPVTLKNTSSNRFIANKKNVTTLAKKPHSPKLVQKKQVSHSKPHKDIYAVQLASFSQKENAQTLVNKLKSKGYYANFAKFATKQGAVYKVYAGHSPEKAKVEHLKTQLATAMQIRGFVVTTGVS